MGDRICPPSIADASKFSAQHPAVITRMEDVKQHLDQDPPNLRITGASQLPHMALRHVTLLLC